MNEYSEYKKIYTDASKTEEGVGSAYITSNTTHQFKLPANSSTFTGEIYALLQALKFINNHDNRRTIIITDSLSAISGIKQMYPSNPILKLIKEELSLVQENNKSVTFIWVPSHIGIRGNEQADRSARDAISNPNSILVTTSLHTDLKHYMKKLIQNQWQSEWEQKKTKLNEIKFSVKPWLSVPNGRRNQVILTRLRIGHTRLTHDYLIKGTEEPKCEICQKKVTVKHFLVECPKYKVERINRQIPAPLSKILDDGYEEKNLMLFLSDINVKSQI